MIGLVRDLPVTPYIFNLDWDGLNRLIYVGVAAPGAINSEEGWRIINITYVGGTENIQNVRHAETGSQDWLEFNKVWDNRTTYTYS